MGGYRRGVLMAHGVTPARWSGHVVDAGPAGEDMRDVCAVQTPFIEHAQQSVDVRSTTLD